MNKSNKESIPVIDLSPLYQGNEQAMDTLVHQVYDAYSKVGFAYITNHGVDSDLINDVFEASRQFHALSLEDKLRIEINQFHRGYIPINTSTDRTSAIEKAARPNQSESFMMMHELEQDDPDVLQCSPLAGPNQWPADLKGFKECVTGYHDALELLSNKVLKVFELALNTDSLSSHFTKPTTWLRLLHYPSLNIEDPEDLFGSNPHIDYGFITILAQDEVGGLQVRDVDDDWIDVPYVKDHFVMNSGEVLNHWSNGKFLATPHRVVNRTGKERYSCPFFFDPNIHSRISTLPSCVEKGVQSKYSDAVFGDMVMSHLRSNHDQHTENN
jgi:isopenicillin N synthase-like dioxygenase